MVTNSWDSGLSVNRSMGPRGSAGTPQVVPEAVLAWGCGMENTRKASVLGCWVEWIQNSEILPDVRVARFNFAWL